MDMSDDKKPETTSQLGIRVSIELHERLVAEQKRAKKLTGYEPTISDVVRALIEEGLEIYERRRAR